MKFTPLKEGSQLGVLGGGQLGRMFSQAAIALGFQPHVFAPETESPAFEVASHVTMAEYSDLRAIRSFAGAVDAVTLEFENVPVECLKALEEIVPARPGAHVLHIAQHRAREKTFLKEAGFPVVEFALVSNLTQAQEALKTVGLPAVLKTAGFGYDGKGQTRIRQESDLVAATSQPGEWVLEAWQDFEKEVSVIVARAVDGAMVDWGVIENRHVNHILDISFSPAAVSSEVEAAAISTARAIAVELNVVGLLCVEFFVGKDGSVRVNEIAPRPHNSGHWTMDGSFTSQFEQQVRCLAGLTLGATTRRPTAMANLLGEVWKGTPEQWEKLKAFPRVTHVDYGKKESRPGRKMGHLTAIAESAEEAVRLVLEARNAL